MLDNKCRIHTRSRKHGFKTPNLHKAVKLNDLTLVEILLKNGADVNDTDGHGQTALHVASTEGFLELAKILLDAGADINAIDHDKRSSLDLVVNNLYERK